MKDESKRQSYDLVYPLLARRRPSPHTTQTPRPPPASTAPPGALNEAAQIVALQKSKQERGVRWQVKRMAFLSSIIELQKGIRKLEQEIKNLDSISDAEVAEEAQKNSWTTWLLSPLSKKVEDTEEEKARKDRERQERRIEKDMKERRLGFKQTEIKREEDLSRKAKKETDDADLVDENKIQIIQARVWARHFRERQEREIAARERQAKVWKQQAEEREKREREAADALRKQQAEKRAAELKRQEEEKRRWQKIKDENRKFQEQYTHPNLSAEGTRQSYTSVCRHDGWWPKVQGRTACPECGDIWTYLLQCPGCTMKGCPKCQAAIRPRISRHTARTNRRVPSPVRTPSPDFTYDFWYD